MANWSIAKITVSWVTYEPQLFLGFATADHNFAGRCAICEMELQPTQAFKADFPAAGPPLYPPPDGEENDEKLWLVESEAVVMW